MTRWARSWLPVATGTAVVLALPAAVRAQQAAGTISGRVTDAVSGAPISAAQIQIVGTNLGALANEQGRYTIRAVPARQVTVRVLRVGYSEQTKTLTITAGGTATADFALRTTAVNLTPVVTTATGETRRVEIGNAISTIDAAKVTAEAPVTNMADLLNSRTPGVSVLSGTQTGTGQRIRIRGANSLSLSNDPIFVIDGVRMTSNNSSISFGTGGNNPGRITDINPEEIENIEIVKGPSAATLYGTDAANGVVVITTKKGRAGAPRWTVYGEGGLISDLNTYTTNYTIAGHSPGATAYRECTLPMISAKTCILDSVRTYSPINDPNATPIGTGHRAQFGGQVSGGTEAVRYFISAERENETGLLRLPDFERARLDSAGLPIREWMDRPNALVRNTLRTNLNAALRPNLDVGLSIGFTNSDARFSLESNATAGLGSHLFGGPGYKTNGNVAVTPSTPLNGYRAWTPGYTWAEKVGQQVNRLIGAANVQFRPTAWLSMRANLGNDFTGRVDDDLRYRGEGPPLTATYRDGYKGNGRTNIRNTSADLGATANVNPLAWLNSKTTLGAQYVNYQLDQGVAEGTTLPPGAQTASAGATPTASEATTLQKTLGLYIEEAVAIREKLFLTAALRTDQNSAFGTNFQRVVYPKASLSWLISDEDFFPRVPGVASLRLRGAYGASGVQPGSNDALRTFAAVTPNVRTTDEAGLAYSAVGNKNLKPERTTEFETGFEAKLFDGRAGLDLTYYRKRTKDALISAIVPPSLGSATSVRQNLGAVQNTGWEALVTTQLLDRRAVAFDVTFNGSINENELVSLGGTPPQIGTTTRAVEGYPLFGLWAQPITGWQDRNGDGILTYDADPAKNEVFVGDSAIFRGYNQPRYMLSVTPALELFAKRIRLTTLFDYRGGNLYYNNTERIRCVSRQNCNGLMNPSASLQEQAMVVATRDHPSKTLDGFFQPGTFWRLREISLTGQLPASLFGRYVKARSVSVTGTARNVWKWTKYRGADPETDFTASEGGNSPSDFQTVAPPSYFILRLNVNF